MSADMSLDTDGVLRSKIIEMKRSGIGDDRLSKTFDSWTLYEVLNVHLQKWIR